jgi:OOP family OmpA-OmpF porin
VSKTPVNKPQASTLAYKPDPSKYVQDVPEKLMYRIALFSSTERVPFNDPRFNSIKTQITEIKKGDHYEYTMLALPEKKDLESQLNEVKAGGFSEARIQGFDAAKANLEVTKTGRYIAPGNADKLNVEFSKLSDIKFEYNSAEIKEESYRNLNYIAAMLKLEENFTLKVAAHTCAIGGLDYNQKLSEERAQAVVDYFVSKGISKDRLIPHGYGMTQPIQSNETVMGRAANRRVEFVIVFKID